MVGGTNENPVDQKDLSDLVSSVFKKELTIDKGPDTVTPKFNYSIVPAIGYTLQTKFAAVISGNAAFHVTPDSRLSTVTASVTYTQNKQFFIPVLSNISTKGNRYKLIGDWRFYKYPQSTFGLGSEAPIENEDPMDYTYIRVYETILKNIKGNFFAGIGYNLDHHWNISHKGNKNGTPSDFAAYDTSQKTTSSGINLTGIYDSRDNPINAKKGFYTNLQLRNNFKFLGSNSNWRSLTFEIRKYFAFPRKSGNVWAFWSYNSIITHGKPPYLDLPSTGWDNYNSTGRGFIQGRYRGNKMVYLETEYRFQLIKNGLLGGVVFANEESFSGFEGSNLQSFQMGYGLGIRVKLNKLSNTNLSIDYGFGTQGSNGLFVTVGEAF
jgi:outer membrane protein assembly factor BamA